MEGKYGEYEKTPTANGTKLCGYPYFIQSESRGITARKDRGSNMSYILTVRIKQIGYEVGWESTFLPALKILRENGLLIGSVTRY